MNKKLSFALHSLACLVIVGVVMELCARTEDKIRYSAPFTGSYSLESLYQFDELGKYGLPNSSYLKWHLNEVGYRGPALRQNTYRIACLGSSETFGLYESAEKEWPRQLEETLNRNQPTAEYEVVDIAYPGLSMGTSLKRLPQMLDSVHPKMVVIYPSYTPYIDTDQPQPWPLPVVPKKTPTHPSHFEWRISGRLQTWSKTVLPESIQTAMRQWQIAHDPSGASAVDVLPQANIDAFAADLQQVTTELQRQGVAVVLVTHANRFGKTVAPEDRQFMTAWRKFFPTLKEAGLLDMEQRMSDAVRKVGAKDSVPVVDAASLIAPGAQNFAEFVHFTDAGSKHLAALVANEIQHEAATGKLASNSAEGTKP
jgi:hypothetical protein